VSEDPLDAIDLDGVRRGFASPVRDALVASGLLVREADGRWRLLTHGRDFALGGAIGVCDFCSGRPIVSLVPCADFLLPTEPGEPERVSQGPWAACAPCGTAVAIGDRTGLFRHCLTVNTLPESRVAPKMLREIHRRFWRHHRGVPVRVA